MINFGMALRRPQITGDGPRRQPPVHHDADHDELILYAEGPGANMPAGYQAWLIEVRPTMRIAPAAQAHAALIETSEYGLQSPA